MRRLFLQTLLYLIYIPLVCAQHAGTDGGKGVNLSLWKNVATQRTDTVGSTLLNLGVYSSMNRLEGIGLNLLSSVVGRDMHGAQISLLTNMTGGEANGLQLAGIVNVTGGDTKGLTTAGLVNINGGSSNGLLLSGLANINGGATRGIILSGLMNISGEGSTGLHLSGLANLSGKEYRGLTLSGLMNIASEDVRGVQLAGIANVTAEAHDGAQVSLLGNVTGGTLRGLQLAPANVAARVKGVQIGLFNYYKDTLDGFQLGLVNANPRTKVQPMAYLGTRNKLNLGARFKNERTYTILGIGTHYIGLDERFSAALTYRAGLELPLYKAWCVSGDLGYQHIETFKNKHRGIPARLYALQARLNLEHPFTERLNLFASLGYDHSRDYKTGNTYDCGWFVEAGLILVTLKGGK